MTIDIELQNAQAMLADSIARYKQLQAEEARLTQVREDLLTAQEQSKQHAQKLKEANEAAIRLRIEAENQAIVVKHDREAAEAAEKAAEAAAKRAQAEEIAAALAEIEAAAEKADALLLGYAEQLAIISKAKRRASQQLTQNFSGYHVQVPHPGMEAEVREGQFKTNELHLTNNAINEAGTFAGTQVRSGQYVSLARVIIAPHLSGAK